MGFAFLVGKTEPTFRPAIQSLSLSLLATIAIMSRFIRKNACTSARRSFRTITSESSIVALRIRFALCSRRLCTQCFLLRFSARLRWLCAFRLCVGIHSSISRRRIRLQDCDAFHLQRNDVLAQSERTHANAHAHTRAHAQRERTRLCSVRWLLSQRV
jgi:hypothetical protein